MYLWLIITTFSHDTDETFDGEQFIPTKLRFRLLPRIRCSCHKGIDVLAPCYHENSDWYEHRLGAEVVMLFAVERLSERSEDWPTKGIN